MPIKHRNYRGTWTPKEPHWTPNNKTFIWLLVLLFVWSPQNFDLKPIFSPYIYIVNKLLT